MYCLPSLMNVRGTRVAFPGNGIFAIRLPSMGSSASSAGSNIFVSISIAFPLGDMPRIPATGPSCATNSQRFAKQNENAIGPA